ncbi:MAG: S8 family serine peptidase [Deltaproteobacteria bacterium]|nr:S8 family serine peptidase [Deltaproteobacteria bacterium]
MPFRLPFLPKWLTIAVGCLGLVLTSVNPGLGSEGEGAAVGQEALLKFSKRLGPAEVQNLLEDEGATVLRYFPLTRIYHVALPPGAEVSRRLKALRERPGVLIAVPNQRVYAQALPNDPQFGLQWALKNTGQGGGTVGNDIGIESVWDEFQDTGSIVVAVIDTGVDFEHPDLAANMWVNPGEIPGNQIDDDNNGYVDDVHGYDFVNNDGEPMDDNSHGTHVAGILGAVGDNAVGVSGVAWQAKIMALKFLDEGATGTTSGAIPAIEYALAQGAKILVNSWGDSNFNPALFDAILAADAQGALFFAAAGNQGRDTDEDPFFPAGYDAPNVVSLASIDADDSLSSFSNFGRLSVDLAAPGGQILSTKPNGTYGYISGTSMATPAAAGAAAVLWSRFPDLSHRQARNLLLQGAAPRAYLQNKTLMGGTLDVAGALAVARDDENQAPIANAGPDQTLELGSRITLQGGATDPDGDQPLIYEWELGVPPGSLSRLSSAFVATPSFVPDQEGKYVATLHVADSLGEAVPDSATITIAGGVLPPPVPVFKVNYRFEGSKSTLSSEDNLPIGAVVTVDAADSQSLFPENLLFEWSLIAKPSGSGAQLSSVEGSVVQFTADRAGVYTLRLGIEDGYNENQAELSLSALAVEDSIPPSAPTPQDPAPSPVVGGCALRPLPQ